MRVRFDMWLRALRTMPRLGRAEWDGLDIISRWLVSTRAAALVMSFLAALMGGLLALRDGRVSIWKWILAAFGLVMAHGTNNLLNDRIDHRRGVDRGNYFRDQYGPQPLETGFLSSGRHLVYAVLTGLFALASGVILGAVTGGVVWVVMAVGALVLLFYTWPLKYIALGELSVFVVWGPLMVGGTYLVLRGSWSWLAALGGVPFALGVAATLVGKHLDKMELDREKRIVTLSVLLGDRGARVAVVVIAALQYLTVIALVVVRYFTPVMLVPLVSLVFIFRVVVPMFRSPRPAERPDAYPEDVWPLWFVAATFSFTRQFGGWYVLGLIVDTVLRLTVLR